MQDTKSNISCIPIHKPGPIHKKIRGKKIPFTEASEKMKYLGINLIKKLKSLYTKSYKTLFKKKSKKIQINGKTAHRLEDLIFVKIFMLHGYKIA